MATTSMWAVKGAIGKVVLYIENPEKTQNPQFYEAAGMSEPDRQALSDVIEYATANEKVRTQHDTHAEESMMESYVTGINCSSMAAREEMTAVKKRYHKEFGIAALHGYQSFAEGEVDAGTAHEIGTKLAEELWGDRFQVVVATHLDQKHHIHNHYVLNSVSYVDGKKFNLCKTSYREMRAASDRLCEEYGLSVIAHPKRGETKHYAQWKANAEGKPTWASLIKEDVDAAIRQSMTDRQFFYLLKQKGYQIKVGKDISVKPEGRGRFFRLTRNFGDAYSKASIDARILSNPVTYTPPKPAQRTFRASGTRKRSHVKKVGGLYGLYLHYLYLLGVLPKQRQPCAKVHFLLKEDILALDKITNETRFLAEHKIETTAQLDDIKTDLTAKRAALNQTKRELTASIKSADAAGDEKVAKAAQAELTGVKRELSQVRKEINLCKGIEERSVTIKEKLTYVTQEENRKERKDHVQSRGRGRASHADDPARR